jgi:hypothetical protein
MAAARSLLALLTLSPHILLARAAVRGRPVATAMLLSVFGVVGHDVNLPPSSSSSELTTDLSL